MQRFKLVLQYIGTKYQGWSKQKHTSNTIQFILEKAAASIANGKPTPITISSRTDKGVHALHNIAHVDFDSKFSEHDLTNAFEFFLRNEDIRVMQVQKVPNDYHARYCTKERTYVYRIITSPDILSPFLKHRVWCIPRKTLNVEEMNSVANQCFLGKRDFKSFHAAKGIEYPSTVREMYEICVSKTTITPNIHFGMKNGEEIVLLFRANAFLYHQVRRMVGILVQVGLGNMSAADVESIIQKKHCSACGGVYVAPAEGLYLSSVLDTL